MFELVTPPGPVEGPLVHKDADFAAGVQNFLYIIYHNLLVVIQWKKSL
jgi:hypothetical protein